MNSLLWLASKLRGNPRFYAPPLFAMLTGGLKRPASKKRTTVLFYYSGRMKYVCGVYPQQWGPLRQCAGNGRKNRVPQSVKGQAGSHGMRYRHPHPQRPRRDLALPLAMGAALCQTAKHHLPKHSSAVPAGRARSFGTSAKAFYCPVWESGLWRAGNSRS